MIGAVALVLGFLVLAVIAFAVSIRLGILVGLRLDRRIVERTSTAGLDGIETPDAAASRAPSTRMEGQTNGQQEDPRD